MRRRATRLSGAGEQVDVERGRRVERAPDQGAPGAGTRGLADDRHRLPAFATGVKREVEGDGALEHGVGGAGRARAARRSGPGSRSRGWTSSVWLRRARRARPCAPVASGWSGGEQHALAARGAGLRAGVGGAAHDPGVERAVARRRRRSSGAGSTRVVTVRSGRRSASSLEQPRRRLVGGARAVGERAATRSRRVASRSTSRQSSSAAASSARRALEQQRARPRSARRRAWCGAAAACPARPRAAGSGGSARAGRRAAAPRRA